MTIVVFAFFFLPHTGIAEAQTLPTLSPGAQDLVQSLEFAPFNEPNFPKVDRIPLPLGGLLYHTPKANSGPLQKLILIFPFGENTEPRSKIPALQLITRWMSESGTKKLAFIPFRKAMQRIGASVQIATEYEYWYIALEYLKQAENQALQLLSELILQPDLKVETLEIIKKKAAAGITERLTSPNWMARMVAQQELYPNSRYAALYQQADLDALDARELQTILRHRLYPKNISVFYTGSQLKKESIASIQSLLHQLALQTPAVPTTLTKPENLPVPLESGNGSRSKKRKQKKIIYIGRENTAQSGIAVGARLPAANDPRQIDFRVGNFILGGASFTSRLSVKIRDQKGFAYFVYSYPMYRKNSGTWLAMMGTKPEQVPQALKTLLQELRTIRNIQPDELTLSKNALINRLLFQQERIERYLWQVYRIDKHGFPKDYLQKFVAQTKKANRWEVGNTTANFLLEENLHIVVVGPPDLAENLQKEFSDFIVEIKQF